MMLAEVPCGLIMVTSPAGPGTTAVPEKRVTTASPGCSGPCCASAADATGRTSAARMGDSDSRLCISAFARLAVRAANLMARARMGGPPSLRTQSSTLGQFYRHVKRGRGLVPHAACAGDRPQRLYDAYYSAWLLLCATQSSTSPRRRE